MCNAFGVGPIDGGIGLPTVRSATLGSDVERLRRINRAVPTPTGSSNAARGRRRRTLCLEAETSRTPDHVQRLRRINRAFPTPTGSSNAAQGRRMRTLGLEAETNCTPDHVQRLRRINRAVPTPTGSSSTAQGRRRRTLGLWNQTNRTPTGFHNQKTKQHPWRCKPVSAGWQFVRV
jgi:hypothetical protein